MKKLNHLNLANLQALEAQSKSRIDADDANLKRLTFPVDAASHSRFKSEATSQQMSMTDYFMEIWRFYRSNHE